MRVELTWLCGGYVTYVSIQPNPFCPRSGIRAARRHRPPSGAVFTCGGSCVARKMPMPLRLSAFPMYHQTMLNKRRSRGTLMK